MLLHWNFLIEHIPIKEVIFLSSNYLYLKKGKGIQDNHAHIMCVYVDYISIQVGNAKVAAIQDQQKSTCVCACVCVCVCFTSLFE